MTSNKVDFSGIAEATSILFNQMHNQGIHGKTAEMSISEIRDLKTGIAERRNGDHETWFAAKVLGMFLKEFNPGGIHSMGPGQITYDELEARMNERAVPELTIENLDWAITTAIDYNKAHGINLLGDRERLKKVKSNLEETFNFHPTWEEPLLEPLPQTQFKDYHRIPPERIDTRNIENACHFLSEVLHDLGLDELRESLKLSTASLPEIREANLDKIPNLKETLYAFRALVNAHQDVIIGDHKRDIKGGTYQDLKNEIGARKIPELTPDTFDWALEVAHAWAQQPQYKESKKDLSNALEHMRSRFEKASEISHPEWHPTQGTLLFKEMPIPSQGIA